MTRVIIDTREVIEYNSGHVIGSINIPPASFLGSSLPKELANLDPDTEIIVYCRTGNRANVVAQILKSKGFSNITNGINQSHVEKLLGAK